MGSCFQILPCSGFAPFRSADIGRVWEIDEASRVWDVAALRTGGIENQWTSSQRLLGLVCLPRKGRKLYFSMTVRCVV
jgi:hypothetical protein